jgi:U3 small nucleolar RNA-associated protein 20
VLRFLLALALAHAKTAGASEGPTALAKAAPQWAPAFALAPRIWLLPFIRALISPPGGAEVARPFAQHVLGALGRCLLAGERSTPVEAVDMAPSLVLAFMWQQHLQAKALHFCSLCILCCCRLWSESNPLAFYAGEHSDLAWPLLMDVCATLRPGVTAGAPGVPILLTASGVGSQLAALVCQTARMGGGTSAADVSREAAQAWAALACLPHAVESAAQAAEACAALADATAAAAEQEAAGGDEHADGGGAALLMLHCTALSAQAQLSAAAGPEGCERVRQKLLPQALALLGRHPSSYHAVAAAAAVLQAAAASGTQLATGRLEKLVPALSPNLSAASQALRRETLRALCAFQQPAMLAPPGSGERRLTTVGAARCMHSA